MLQDAQDLTKVPTSSADWLELDRKYRLQSRYTAPVVLDRGKGTTVWDVEGRAYLDFVSGQICTVTGHSHPRYVEAIATQAAKFIQRGSGFTDTAQIRLALKVAEIVPPPFQKSYFASTGSESNEAALRMAKLVTGNFEVASLIRGYLGMTAGSFSATGLGSAFRKGYGPYLPGIIFLPPPYCYRCSFGRTYPGCDLACFEFSKDMLDRTSSGHPAAFLFEVIIGAGGMIDCPPEWVQAMRQLCTERGTLMIVDEAQTGFGRCGDWFAYEATGVIPDIITVSKGLGGGVPLCAVIVSNELATALQEKRYYQSSSHTGDPLLSAAGYANLSIIQEEGLVENAARVGAYFKRGLLSMQERYEQIGDVRGRGLMLGFELVEDRTSKKPAGKLAERFGLECQARGLIVGHIPGVVSEHYIRFLPPLNVTQVEVDRALDIMDDVLNILVRDRASVVG